METWLDRVKVSIAELEARGLTPELALTRAVLLGAVFRPFSGFDSEHKHGAVYVVDNPKKRGAGLLGLTQEMCAYRFLMHHHPHALEVHKDDTP